MVVSGEAEDEEEERRRRACLTWWGSRRRTIQTATASSSRLFVRGRYVSFVLRGLSSSSGSIRSIAAAAAAAVKAKFVEVFHYFVVDEGGGRGDVVVTGD